MPTDQNIIKKDERYVPMVRIGTSLIGYPH